MDPRGAEPHEIVESPWHLERIAGVARALRAELESDAMVEIVTFGRLTARSAVPEIGPAHATRRAREALASRVRVDSALTLGGVKPGGRALAIGVPILVRGLPVGVISAWFRHAVLVQEPSQVVELAATGLAGWWEGQEQRRKQETSLALDGDRARERERQRLAHDLHGSVAQELAAARINAEIAGLGEATGTTAEDQLSAVRSHIEVAQAQARRLISALGARAARDETLEEIVDRLSREYDAKLNFHRRVDVSMSVSDLPRSASVALCEAVDFVLRELLQNVYEHAVASHVSVIASFRDSQLTLRVMDDGVGMARAGSADGDVHLGVDGIRQRMRSLGGSVTFKTSTNAGTRVTACFPVEDPAAPS